VIKRPLDKFEDEVPLEFDILICLSIVFDQVLDDYFGSPFILPLVDVNCPAEQLFSVVDELDHGLVERCVIFKVRRDHGRIRTRRGLHVFYALGRQRLGSRADQVSIVEDHRHLHLQNLALSNDDVEGEVALRVVNASVVDGHGYS